MTKTKEFENESIEELKAIYQDLSKEIFQMRNEISTTKKLEKPHLLRKKKRDRARVLTLLRKREQKV